MTTIERLTFCTRRKPGQGAKPTVTTRKLNAVELADLNAKTNTQRLVAYITKRDNQERAA